MFGSYPPTAWFRCPCGFEAGGDWETVEAIHDKHYEHCRGAAKATDGPT